MKTRSERAGNIWTLAWMMDESLAFSTEIVEIAKRKISGSLKGSGNEGQKSGTPGAHGVVSQPVGFLISMARDVSDGKLQRARQLPAGPVQGVQTRAATGVFTRHLLHDKLRIGKNLQRSGFHLKGPLQSFEQGRIFGDVVVLMANPFGNANQFPIRRFDNHADARRSRAAMGTAINVRRQNGHSAPWG